MKLTRSLFCVVVFLAAAGPLAAAEGNLGFYRYPALHGKTLVFTAEGDLWKVPLKGGLAQRLTTHPELERSPAFSPDGKTIAFSASYEGPTEIYTMPIAGGQPERVTFEGYSAHRAPYAVGWKSPSEILYATRYFARRDPFQLALANVEADTRSPLPLEQASDGVFNSAGSVLYFTRLPRQSSHAKRYKGGFIENLWRYETGAEEASPLTADYSGTSRSPMLWKGRLYFVTDRDGTMNIWSMDTAGGELRQHTKFAGWDVLAPSLHKGRIVFQMGADIWLYDIGAKKTRAIPIRLASDFDQQRQRWLEKPLQHLSDYGISGDGEKVVVTVRGRAFVAPVKPGRLVQVPRKPGTRHRSAAFLPGTDRVYYLSDESGETEFWSGPADGTAGQAAQITDDARTLRYNGAASPDAKHIAYTDRDQILWLLDVSTGESREVARSEEGTDFDYPDVQWSPDSRWIAFSDSGENLTKRVFLFDAQSDAEDSKPIAVTTDRLDSYSPAWSADGKWLYFLSDRSFRSVQRSPWGPRQPEAYLDKTTKVYLLDLVGGQRSPFAPDDELSSAKKSEEDDDKTEKAKPEKPEVKVLIEGLAQRLHPVPLDAGNYRDLSVSKGHLYFFRSPLDLDRKRHLTAFPISNDAEKRKWATIVEDCRSFLISNDRSAVVVRKSDDLHVFPANGKKPEILAKAKVDLSAIAANVRPADEWRQMFVDAWRLHRDYFYDPAMHKVDWAAVRKKHEVLLPRVSDRWELDDLIEMMVGELSAMHTNVGGGDVRDGAEGASFGYLGARLARAEDLGGYRVEYVYQNDPDFPNQLAPVARPGTDIAIGDIITSIDGTPTLSVRDVAQLLQNKASRQVLVEAKRDGVPEPRKFLVKPLSHSAFRSLKLSDWEYTRRLKTEQGGDGEIGYFHMRAMGSGNYEEFVRGFYPVFDRKGLVIDMRQNYGGNIDSWVLGRLMRKAWMYWQARTGRPSWNMQYAFTGHMVVLIDAYTISDGEAFSEGFRRLGLGPLIGTQTWGGGIWLRSNNRLVDGGIARSPEFGVYAPSGVWLIEGEGIKPDIEVDNLPHQSFLGEDAQLAAAIEYLKKKIAEDPPKIPPPPPRPDKSFDYKDR